MAAWLSELLWGFRVCHVFPVSVHTASEVVAVVAHTESLSSCCEWCPADTGPPLLPLCPLFSPQQPLITVLKWINKWKKTRSMTLPAPQPIDLNECWISIRHSFANDSWTTSGSSSTICVCCWSIWTLLTLLSFPSSSNGWVWGWTVSVQQQKVYTDYLEVWRRWRLLRQQWWRKLS